jgi:ribosomal protein S19E (S16A)
MKKCVNGKYIEMTAKEIEEREAMEPEIPKPVKTEIEKRVDEIEKWRTRIASCLERVGLGDDK